jgi:glucosamine-6-phosphate deaminase
MSMSISAKQLYQWCRVPCQELEGHPDLKVPFRLVKDSESMGQLMARELVDEIQAAASRGEGFRGIIPCGPSCWYQPFTELVNRERVSLRRFEVFHMDECLDWQGRERPRSHPYSFRGDMERRFYDPVDAELAVPEVNRRWLRPDNIEEIRKQIAAAPIRLTYGGWGQDGHIAYNQARRHPYSRVSLEQLRASTVRIQENNWDTILALAQRSFGSAYQFVPPMSVTLGLRECLSAAKVRLFSDTGAWKQTALRVALFSEHPDALITATVETATHPVSIHPEWDLGLES